jgi:TP901 family phage tail tape measure protein
LSTTVGEAVFEIKMEASQANSSLRAFENDVRSTIQKLEGQFRGLGSSLKSAFTGVSAQPLIAQTQALAGADKAYWQGVREDRARDKALSTAYYAALREDSARTRAAEKSQALEVIKAVRGIADAVATERSTYQATGKDIDGVKARLEALKAQAVQMRETLVASGTASTGSIRQLAAATASAEGTILGLEGKVSRLGVGYQVTTSLQQSFGQSIASIVPFGNELVAILTEIAGQGQEAGDGLKATTVAGFGIVGLVGAAAAVGAAFVDAGKAAGAFQTEIAFIATETDKSVAQLKPVADGILSLSTELGKSSTDLAKGVYDIIGASVKGAQDGAGALGLLEVSAKAAVAGLTDTKVATDVITSSLNAYGLEARDAGAISDILFKTVAVGKTTFEQLSAQLGDVLGTAATAKISFGELNAGIAALTASGVKTPQAVTGIRQALENVIGAGKDAKAVAKSLGLEFDAAALASKGLVRFLQDVAEKSGGNVTVLKRLFTSTEALNAVSNLTSRDGLARLKSGLEDITNSSGATDTAFEKVASTYEKSLDRFKEAWGNLKIALGEDALPALQSLVESAIVATNELLAALGKRAAFKPLAVQDVPGFAGKKADTDQAAKILDLQKQINAAIKERNRLLDARGLTVDRAKNEALAAQQLEIIINLRKQLDVLKNALPDAKPKETPKSLSTPAGKGKDAPSGYKPTGSGSSGSEFVDPTPAQLARARELLVALEKANTVANNLALSKFEKSGKGAAEAVRAVRAELNAQAAEDRKAEQERKKSANEAEQERKRIAREAKADADRAKREGEQRAKELKAARDSITGLESEKAYASLLTKSNAAQLEGIVAAQKRLAIEAKNSTNLEAYRTAVSRTEQAERQLATVRQKASDDAIARAKAFGYSGFDPRAASSGSSGAGEAVGKSIQVRALLENNKASVNNLDRAVATIDGTLARADAGLIKLSVSTRAYLEDSKKLFQGAANELSALSLEQRQYALSLDIASADNAFAYGLQEGDAATQELISSLVTLDDKTLAHLATTKRMLTDERFRVAVQLELRRRYEESKIALEKLTGGLEDYLKAANTGELNIKPAISQTNFTRLTDLETAIDSGKLTAVELDDVLRALAFDSNDPSLTEWAGELTVKAKDALERTKQLTDATKNLADTFGTIPQAPYSFATPELKGKPETTFGGGITAENLGKTAEERKQALELVRREQVAGLSTQEDVNVALERYQRALQAQINKLGLTSVASRELRIALAGVNVEISKLYDPGSFEGGSPGAGDVLAGFGGTPEDFDAQATAIERSAEATKKARDELDLVAQERDAGLKTDQDVLDSSFKLSDALVREIGLNQDNAEAVRLLTIQLGKLRQARKDLINDPGSYADGSPSAYNTQTGTGNANPEPPGKDVLTPSDIDRFIKAANDLETRKAEREKALAEGQKKFVSDLQGVGNLFSKLGSSGQGTVGGQVAGQIGGSINAGIGIAEGLATGNAVGVITSVLDLFGQFQGALDPLFIALEPLAPLLTGIGQIFGASLGAVAPFIELVAEGLGALAPILTGILVPAFTVIGEVLKFFANITIGIVNGLSDLVRIVTFGVVNLGHLDYVGQKKTPTKTNPDKTNSRTDSDAGKAFGIAPVGIAPSISLTGASSANVAVGGGQIVAAEVQLNAANIFGGHVGQFGTHVGQFGQHVGVVKTGASQILAAAQLFAANVNRDRNSMTYGDGAL